MSDWRLASGGSNDRVNGSAGLSFGPIPVNAQCLKRLHVPADPLAGRWRIDERQAEALHLAGRPEKALVLCCDEKSQCQALERTQRGLPLKKGYSRTQTHDYIRNGTITLFAASSYLEGKIISRTEGSHTHLEWLRFLKQIDRETPKELDLHLIVDNYATDKHPVVQHWLSRHPRFHTHFTPTSSSWLNLVERFFGELISEVVREGSFQSLGQLARAIEFYLVARNANPKKYVWRASGLEILEKIKRAREALAAADVIST
jgi:hypothetical protein